MKTTPSRKRKKTRKPFHVATCGCVKVPVYERTMPNGKPGYLLANYASGTRRFDSYANSGLVIEAADKLARKLSERDVIGASMTREQAIDFASATQTLKPTGVLLTDAVSRFVEAFNIAGDVVAAAKFYRQRHKQTTAKRVTDVVAELLTVKESRGASKRYLEDLRSRLNTFAADFVCDAGNVTTPQVQSWLDARKHAAQGYMNFRRVLHLLFGFAVARGYASDNPAAACESVKINGRDIAVYSPTELAKLLATAIPDFKPVLALQAFAGLRSAEVERLEWSDIHLAERHVVIGASRAKTASRRIAPLSDNAAAWLADYAGQTGKVWRGSHEDFYQAQADTAKTAGVKWKANALRHSAASYMFALSNDAGRVAGFLGNSAAVIHKHYRELVSPKAAQAWFAVRPDGAASVPPALPANVLTIAAIANA